MKKKRIIFLPIIMAIVGMVATISPAMADDCAQKAEQMAKQANAELLSAKMESGKCVIKMRVAGKNGEPPRIVSKTVDG